MGICSKVPINMFRRCIKITEYYIRRWIFLVNFLNVTTFPKTPEICQKGFQKLPRTFQRAFWRQEFLLRFQGQVVIKQTVFPMQKRTATKLILIQSVKPEYDASLLNHAPPPPSLHNNWVAFLKSGINNCLFFGLSGYLVRVVTGHCFPSPLCVLFVMLL